MRHIRSNQKQNLPECNEAVSVSAVFSQAVPKDWHGGVCRKSFLIQTTVEKSSAMKCKVINRFQKMEKKRHRNKNINYILRKIYKASHRY